MKNLIAVGFVWFCCAIAWVILGTTLVHRSGESSAEMNSEVRALWGPPREQHPPAASHTVKRVVREKETRYGPNNQPFLTTVEREESTRVPIPLDASNISVNLRIEHRRKGLLWFPTYAFDFEGRYTFLNPADDPILVNVSFPLESGSVVYDGLEVRDAGQLIDPELRSGAAFWSRSFAPHERREYVVRYRSRGISSWRYGNDHGIAGDAGRARSFVLTATVNDPGIDFPAGTLSPTRHARTEDGWSGSWEFENIVTTAGAGIELPQRLNPGPLASRITFFAPVSLLFFFFVVAVLATARRVELHPMNYFFFGCAFFAFHLLFAYLVDHLSIAPAFAISSAVSLLLVVTYAQWIVGWRFALREMGFSQLLYLVLFSFTFFWKGYTGLAITIGAVLTLFVVMQISGRADRRARRGSEEEGGLAAS